jgi:hypothetical protein
MMEEKEDEPETKLGVSSHPAAQDSNISLSWFKVAKMKVL